MTFRNGARIIWTSLGYYEHFILECFRFSTHSPPSSYHNLNLARHAIHRLELPYAFYLPQCSFSSDGFIRRWRGSLPPVGNN